VKNVVRRSSLSQDRFDCRRDFDQVFGRVSRGRPFEEAPPSATSAPVSTCDRVLCRQGQQGVLSSSVASQPPSGESSGKRSPSALQRKTKRSEKGVDFHGEEIRIIRTNIHPAKSVDTYKWNTEYGNGVLELAAPLADARPPHRLRANT